VTGIRAAASLVLAERSRTFWSELGEQHFWVAGVWVLVIACLSFVLGLGFAAANGLLHSYVTAVWPYLIVVGVAWVGGFLIWNLRRSRAWFLSLRPAFAAPAEDFQVMMASWLSIYQHPPVLGLVIAPVICLMSVAALWLKSRNCARMAWLVCIR
jgi:hypothetical protein